MNLTISTVRELCTEAVFERGEDYLDDGRISQLSRFGDTVTAGVVGSRPYDLEIECATSPPSYHCSCPYDGPGACKHVVAVLLRLVEDEPSDESDRIDDLLADCSAETLRAFLRAEFASDPSLRDRFRAHLGVDTNRSPEEIKSLVERLFDNHTREYGVVFEPIDFTELFDLAAEHEANGTHRAAVPIYRGLIEGIDDNIELVDGAYDHFASAFQDALDGFVDCVVDAELADDAIEDQQQFLEQKTVTGADFHREQFRIAADELETRLG